MSKDVNRLYVMSRDGKSINDFLSTHNLSKENIRIVKSALDLEESSKGDRYVLIRPLPLSYQWSIRPTLILKEMINVTRKYINKQINF